MLKYAKITTIDNDNCKITFIGESNESSMEYYVISTYNPTINDIVAVDDKAKIILGKVVKYVDLQL